MFSCVAIVPAWRAEDTIGRTLSSLDGQGFAKVVVVISPGDRTAERVGRLSDHLSILIEIVCCRRRVSAGLARNIGRSKAGDCHWLMFVDADTILDPGSLTRLVDKARNSNLDAAAAAIVRHGNGFLARVRHALEFKEAEGRAPAPSWWRIPSTALLVRTRAFDHVSGFPDVWPGEDLQFDWRLESAGYRRALIVDVECHHLHPRGFREMLRHQRRLGHSAALARLQTAMIGAAFARRPLLGVMLAPLRLVRGLAWYASKDPMALPPLLVALPLWVAGVCAWTYGFVRHSSDIPDEWAGVSL